MGMIVQHNMNAINAYNRLNANVAGLKKASEKLASGYRINRAGDDAAGLAISEKMRSQIRGLNQAVRNSQDGINMIQTFEGAAQETHNILQRMKELAVESANGTYDNATDRAAIELEFQQLNDELNQIADTDFNGTIVLNGGVMSDGLKADGNNEFNYKEQFDANYEVVDGKVVAKTDGTEPKDVTKYVEADNYADEAEHQILDNANYNDDAAKALWDALGLDESYDEVNITFTYDGENWNAAVATDKDGNVIASANIGALDVETVGATATNSGAGGFKVNDANVNAIFNAYASNKGDYLTLNFTYKASTAHAPTNAGIMEDSLEDPDAADPTNAADYTVSSLKFELTDGLITDDNIADYVDILDALNAATFTINADGTLDIDDTTNFQIVAGTTDADGNTTYQIADANDANIIYGTVTVGKLVGEGAGAPATDGSATINNAASYAGTLSYDKDSVDAAVKAKGNTTLTGEWSSGAMVWTNTEGDTVDLSDYGITLDVALAAANDGMTIDFVAPTDEVQAGGATQGSYEFQLNIDGYSEGTPADVGAHAVETSEGALEGLANANDPVGSSKSNAFNNSTARLTYADHIILQTGARSKDAVDFTFAYNTDGTADMGDLIANLDISARANGLNTENLTLANQADANYAIDQIDKAINKVSMVRATFGAIQNRLEHKITNLTTTAENLTEAESSIRDTDMAQEMMNYTKFNILQQAAQSMLAQANQQPQSILQLLG